MLAEELVRRFDDSMSGGAVREIATGTIDSPKETSESFCLLLAMLTIYYNVGAPQCLAKYIFWWRVSQRPKPTGKYQVNLSIQD